MNWTKLMAVFLLCKDGFCLLFILIGSICSKRILKYYWNKYKVFNTPMNVFNLCVNWLYHTKDKYNIDYETINTIIFCIIWPLITIISLILNIILIIKLL